MNGSLWTSLRRFWRWFTTPTADPYGDSDLMESADAGMAGDTAGKP